MKIFSKCPFLIITLVITVILFIYGIFLDLGLLSSVKTVAGTTGENHMEVAVAVRDLKTRATGLFEEEDDYDYTGTSAPAEYVPNEELKERMASAGGAVAFSTEDSSTEEDSGQEKDTGSDDTEAKEAAERKKKAEEEAKKKEEEEREQQEQARREAEEQARREAARETPQENDESFVGPYDGFYAVEDGYFGGGDTLFIGDSRVKGFEAYSNIPGIVVYAEKGYAIHQVFKKKFIRVQLDPPPEEDIGKVTLEEAMALQPDKFKKIYIKFGLNEMGWGNEEMFSNAYYRLIDMLKYYQPNAVIYVQSVICVSKVKSGGSSLFNNENVKARNEALKVVADNEHICYLDLNTVFADEEGCLPSDYTSDGIHIRSKYMQIWADFLKKHAVISGESDWQYVSGLGAKSDEPEAGPNGDGSQDGQPQDGGQTQEGSQPQEGGQAQEGGQNQEGGQTQEGGNRGDSKGDSPDKQEEQPSEEIIETDWETGGGL